jgi:hypothetical protein
VANTASAGPDFDPTVLTGVTIPYGQLSKLVAVTIRGDTTVEPDETFYGAISNGSVSILDGVGVATITNDDCRGTRAAGTPAATRHESPASRRVFFFVHGRRSGAPRLRRVPGDTGAAGPRGNDRAGTEARAAPRIVRVTPVSRGQEKTRLAAGFFMHPAIAGIT